MLSALADGKIVERVVDLPVLGAWPVAMFEQDSFRVSTLVEKMRMVKAARLIAKLAAKDFLDAEFSGFDSLVVVPRRDLGA